MEQTGTYSESDRKKLGIGKEAQGRHDLHIRISSENYIFLKEYFRNRFSETIDKLLSFLRTKKPLEMRILIEEPRAGFEPATACLPSKRSSS